MTTKQPAVVIDGVRYVPENSAPIPDRVSIYYMHDNHTFSPLRGELESIIEQARAWGRKSPYGMLCPVILLRGKEELRKIGGCVHARKELGDTAQWEAAVRSDAEAMRLIAASTPP